MIAALFVAKGGCYFGLPNVDPWDEVRDARFYGGPWAVVAHPPCQRWGSYWNGGPSSREPRKLGDDGGCFSLALAAVRRWGGVLEHPANSRAWAQFAIHKPLPGGWIACDQVGGYTCLVEQGHYGHRARKPTWLYAAGPGFPEHLPTLKWGPSDTGEPSAPRTRTRGIIERMGKRERISTPVAFRDVLIELAMSSYQPAQATDTTTPVGKGGDRG